MENSPFHQLPDELLEAIIWLLPPAETLAFGATSRRGNKIAYEDLVWRAHCVNGWRYWESSHELEGKLKQPAAATLWRQLYIKREHFDRKALATFNELLKTQQHRIQRTEDISGLGYDAKDLLLSLRNETPDDAEDVLARRWYADAVLGQIHRKTALEKWTRIHKRQMVRLEEVLGAYDMFILGGNKGDLNDIDQEFDRLAEGVRQEYEGFDGMSIRDKATRVAQYLKMRQLVDNKDVENYHALRNNFLSMALFDDVHTSLPLQSVAIYCAVARRLGVNAKPSNYPEHVHAVIEAPLDVTLDGRERAATQDQEPEFMFMDPWRQSEEVPQDQLTLRLTQMGVPQAQHANHLGPGSNLAITLRAGRNIMYSVQQARDRQRGNPRESSRPDTEAAWYSMLWSMMILGDPDPAAALHRRRQCLPYIAEHFQQHFPEDLGFVEKIIGPMFDGERESHVLMHVFTSNRAGDRNAKAPNRRDSEEKQAQCKIGHYFQHKRFGYEGIVVGWDHKCTADPRWIHQMRVDDLPGGREQPFYNVM